jgi:mono/diheme cytochrome c family protein
MVTGATLRALAAAVAITVAVPAVALAYRGSTVPTKLVGNPAAGKPLFVSTCGVCHKLRDAKTAGTIGPNLDKARLTEPMIVKAITYGGASVMTKAQVAKYSTRMVAYKNVLSKKQIQDIAAYVYKATHRSGV